MVQRDRIREFVLLTLVGAGLWASVGTAAAQVVERRDSVEGAVHVAPPCEGPPPCIEQPRYAFHIVTEADGRGPQGHITYSTGERASVFAVRGAVTCATVSGNHATVAANLDESIASPGQPQELDELLRRADLALYEAKTDPEGSTKVAAQTLDPRVEQPAQPR